MMRLQTLLLFLGALISFAVAESAPTFCKCTCFTNSTIVRLGPQDSSDSTTSPQILLRSLNPFTRAPPLEKRAASSSCNQCNRAFCLKYNLPICKDVTEKDVVAMCFQRDSRKDQLIVWAFILGTMGLLGWAGMRRVVEMREAKKAGLGMSPRVGVNGDRGAYIPVGESVR